MVNINSQLNITGPKSNDASRSPGGANTNSQNFDNPGENSVNEFPEAKFVVDTSEQVREQLPNSAEEIRQLLEEQPELAEKVGGDVNQFIFEALKKLKSLEEKPKDELPGDGVPVVEPGEKNYITRTKAENVTNTMQMFLNFQKQHIETKGNCLSFLDDSYIRQNGAQNILWQDLKIPEGISLDLRGNDLSNVDFSLSLEAKKALDVINLENADLSFVDLRGAKLVDDQGQLIVKLNGANLMGAQLDPEAREVIEQQSQGVLFSIKPQSALFKNKKIENSTDKLQEILDWYAQANPQTRLALKQILGPKAINPRLVDWQSLEIPDAMQLDFSEVNLNNVDFSSMAFDGVNFAGASLKGTNFSEASINDCNFAGAKFSKTDFYGAHLSDLSLSGLKLKSTNLEAAYLNNVNLSGAKLDFSNLCETQFVACDLVDTSLKYSTVDNTAFPDSSINEKTLNELPLEVLDLTAADLEHFDMRSPILRELQIGHADLRSKDFEGQNNLQGLDLPFADLRGTDLGLVIISDENRNLALNLENANLIGAKNIYPNARKVLEQAPGIVLPPASNDSKDITEALQKHLNWLSVVSDPDKENLLGRDFFQYYDAKLVNWQDIKVPENIKLSLAQVNLDGVNFEGLDLRKFFLHGASLRGTNFKNANLDGVDLRMANLEEADLSGASLVQASLKKAKMKAAKIAQANFEKAELANVVDLNLAENLNAAIFNGANLFGAQLVEADLSGIQMKGAKLKFVNFNGSSLVGADLSGAVLDGVTMVTTNLENTDLNDASLVNANLLRAKLNEGTQISLDQVGVKPEIRGLQDIITWYKNSPYKDDIGFALNLTKFFEDVDPKSIDWKNLETFEDIYLDLSGLNLDGIDLSGLNLEGFDFSGASLVGANLSGTTLKKADFSGAILDEANLKDANLVEAQLANASLRSANLENVNFDSADLQSANLDGANIVETDFFKANLSEASANAATLDSASLLDANIRGLSLKESKIIGSTLAFTKLAGVDLAGADLTEANLHEQVSLNRANLARVNFSGQDLAGADLRKTNLTEANLTGARLFMTKFDGAQLQEVNFEGTDTNGASFAGALDGQKAFDELPLHREAAMRNKPLLRNVFASKPNFVEGSNNKKVEPHSAKSLSGQALVFENGQYGEDQIPAAQRKVRSSYNKLANDKSITYKLIKLIKEDSKLGNQFTEAIKEKALEISSSKTALIEIDAAIEENDYNDTEAKQLILEKAEKLALADLQDRFIKEALGRDASLKQEFESLIEDKVAEVITNRDMMNSIEKELKHYKKQNKDLYIRRFTIKLMDLVDANRSGSLQNRSGKLLIENGKPVRPRALKKYAREQLDAEIKSKMIKSVAEDLWIKSMQLGVS